MRRANRAPWAAGRGPRPPRRPRRSTVRLWLRACSRTRWKAARSSTLWRSMRIPLARSMSARRSSAFSRRVDLRLQLVVLAPAAHGDLDGALDRVRGLLARVGEDPAVGGGGHELGILAVEQRDDRPGGEGVDLLDQVERVLVVAVDDDDRQVRVVARDGLGGLAQADGDLGRRVPELAHLAGGDLERPRVLVGQENPQRRLSFSSPTRSAPTSCVAAYTGQYNAVRDGTAQLPARPAVRPTAPALVPRSSAMASLRDPHSAVRAAPNGRRRLDRGRSAGEHEAGRQRQPRRAGPRAVRALPGQARSGRPRDARRALPAARAPARAPLPAPRGALRRPLPGRLPRAGQGDRPLRPRAARSPSRATRCRPSSARSSATSATARGRCACRATCRSWR